MNLRIRDDPDPAQGRRDHWLGVDAGATHTTAAVFDPARRVRWRGESGPIDHLAGIAGERRMRTTLATLVESVPPDLRASVGCAAVGLSGMSIPGKADLCRRALSALMPRARIRITSDLVAAVWGATGGEDGMILLCGTGSAALGLKAGARIRAGGHGSQFGDEGSAYAIAAAGIRAAIRAAEDRGPATTLVADLARAGGVDRVDLIAGTAFAQEWDAGRVAALARVVASAAGGGDAVARAILREAARDLTELGAAVLRRMGTAVPVYLVGRGWLLSPALGRSVRRRLRGRFPGALSFPRNHGDGALGAVLWAAAERDAGGDG